MEPRDDQIYAFDGITARLAKSPRLGLGELSSKEIQCWIARNMLFHFIERLAQKELRELRDACAAPFNDLRSATDQSSYSWKSDFPAVVIRTAGENCYSERLLDITSWQSLGEAAPHYASADALRAAIESWTAKYNLAGEWVSEAAWRLICIWFDVAYAKPRLVWCLPGSFGIGPGGGRFVSGLGFDGSNKYRPHLVPAGIRAEIPVLPPYDPVGMTRIEYLDRVHRLAAAYCELQEAGYKKLNLVPTRQLRGKSGSPWLHWLWFVKFQVKRLNAEEIAKASAKSNIDASTVYAGVKNVAKLVDLALRKKNQRRRANLK